CNEIKRRQSGVPLKTSTITPLRPRIMPAISTCGESTRPYGDCEVGFGICSNTMRSLRSGAIPRADYCAGSQPGRVRNRRDEHLREMVLVQQSMSNYENCSFVSFTAAAVHSN